MKKQVLFHIFLILLVSVGIAGGKVLAQSSPPSEIKFTPDVEIPIQGRLLSASGVPVNGPVTLGLRLYSAVVSGTLLCEDSHSVTVNQGLYTTTLTCPRQIMNGQELYLGVTVGADAEMSPRQKLLPIPYAVSFLPGASVQDTSGSGPILSLVGKNAGIPGAFYVMNNNANGIAAWLDNDSGDATLVLRNSGSGALLKGFGGNGGEDEFRVNNNGSIQSLGDTFLFIPGNQAFLDPAISPSYFTVKNELQGISIDDNMDGANFNIILQIALPSVLYGFPVDIEDVTVYYRVTDSGTYFNRIYLGLMPPPPTTTDIAILDYTGGPFNQTTYSSFSVPVNNYTLSENHGLLHLRLYGWTNVYSSVVYFYGVRIRLGHTNTEP